MALALGENRDQHVGAGHLLAARRLHVDDGALDHALEAGGRLGILVAVAHQVFELALEIGGEAAAQLVEIDVARAHDRGGVLIVDQREQQMFERGVFVVALVGERQGAVEGLFEIARKRRHVRSRVNALYSPGVPAFPSSSLFFHHALQRMLVFAGKVHNLRHLGLGHLVGIDPALADAVLVHVHHDAVWRPRGPC